MSDTTDLILREANEKQNKWGTLSTVDEYLSKICLDMTIGGVSALAMTAANARCYFCCRMIFDAVFLKEIDTIQQIVSRVDGTVPLDKDRDKYANLIGDAIDDVLDYEEVNRLAIFPEDTVIIALAKVIVQVSVSEPGKNIKKQRDKQSAINMILQRTGGKKVEPVKLADTIKYIEPEWAKGELNASINASVSDLQEEQTGLQDGLPVQETNGSS